MSDYPRIYVACLAAYNNGKLHGAWIDLDGTEDVEKSIAQMLTNSPETGAEEWAIHDHEFCNNLSEYSGLDEIKKIAQAYEECRRRFMDWEMFALYCRHTGRGLDPEHCDYVEEVFAGCHDSMIDWAYSYVEETGMLNGASPELTRYFNYEAFADDMERDSILTIPHNGEVFVFWYL